MIPLRPSEPPSPLRQALAAGILAAAVAGCTPPDRPSRLGSALPPPVLAWLAPDTARITPLARGVVHRYYWSPRGPWAVHLVEVDLERCALTFDVVRARREGGQRGALETVSSMVEREPGTVVVAVNGDFFTPEGSPLGPEVSRGAVTHGRPRPGLGWLDGHEPAVGVLAPGAEGVEGSGWPAHAGGEVEVVGGFPQLLDEGRRVGDLEVRSRPSFAASRHPRTAVGYDGERRRLWLAVVDGRQGSFSMGMTLPELTTLFELLGVEEALNLDGGGSTTLVGRGRLLNRPSDAAGERPVVNALLLKEDGDACGVSAPPPSPWRPR